jgi:hypothetical protein
MGMRFLTLPAVLLLAACQTVGAQSGIAPGQTNAQVIAQMGQPDGYRSSGNVEVLTYSDRLISGWSWGRADYQVILRNGRVAEYGFGQVGDASPNVGTIIFVPLTMGR